MLNYLDQDGYLELLKIGLHNIRRLAAEGDTNGCFVEADHLHNVPAFLRTLNEGAERYYWEVERASYMDQANAVSLAEFRLIWQKAQIGSGGQ
jgi:hypothetical protein